MARIQYKSDKEKLYRKSFNPFVASNEEIEKDIELQERYYELNVSNLFYYVGNDDLAKKILDDAYNTTPFDKKIIKDSNVKSVDNVNVYDYTDEETFRDVLRTYYCLIRIIDNYRTDREVLDERKTMN